MSYHIERFWNACNIEFSEQRVLGAVGEAAEWIEFAEALSNYYRGEQPELDEAFDRTRAAVAKLHGMLGGNL